MEDDLKEKEQAEQTTEAADQTDQPPAETEQMKPASESGDNPQEQDGGQEKTDDTAAEKTVQASETEDTEEDSDDAKDEQEEKPEKTDEDAPKQNENPAMDMVNQEILNVAVEAGVENDEKGEQGDPDRAFDTLDDLKKLSGESVDENGEDTTTRAIQDRKGILQLRKGNLYKAVIYAKMLENGQNPAGEEKKLDAGQPAASGGRFNRFLNSSKLDKAGKVLKTANAVSGLAGMADSNYKDSRLSGLIGTANDVLILVNSIRGIIKKLRDFKKNSTSTIKKVFAVVGLVSDFGTAISKGASLAKKLADKRGWSVLSKVLGYISTISAIAGQTAALMNVCNTIKDLAISTRPIKKAQKEEKKNVLDILDKYNPKAAPENDAEQEKPGEEKKEAAPEEEKKEAAPEEGKKEAAPEEGKKEAAPGEEKKEAAPEEEKKEDKKEKKSKRKRLRQKLGQVMGPVKKHKVLKEKILTTLERPDVSKEDKAVLASYLGRARILSKRKLVLANASTGLITATMGMGATLSKTAMDYSPKEDIKTKKEAGMSALVFGGLTNSMMLASNISMSIAGKKVNGGPGEREGNLIKEGLYGALHDLGDERFGLRKIAAKLVPDNPDHEHLQEAEYAMRRYETASKQFAGSGVNYARLFAANNINAFKDSLVASL